MPTRPRDTHRIAAIRRRGAPGDTDPGRRARSVASGNDRSDTASSASPTLSVLRDLTTPIPVERRLILGFAPRTLLILGGAAAFVALLAALFVIPIQNWRHQRTEIEQRRSQLEVLQRANTQLEIEVARLRTADGIEQAAREELGFIQRGEQRITMTDAQTPSQIMPTGWPYNVVADIINARIPRTVEPVADAGTDEPATGDPTTGDAGTDEPAGTPTGEPTEPVETRPVNPYPMP